VNTTTASASTREGTSVYFRDPDGSLLEFSSVWETQTVNNLRQF
jgi:hypothetical protein